MTDLWDRDPCDGCDGTCGDVCPVMVAQREALDRSRSVGIGVIPDLEREIAELRAGISWARGLCTDEMPHAQIDHFLGCVLAGKAELPGASEEETR